MKYIVAGVGNAAAEVGAGSGGETRGAIVVEGLGTVDVESAVVARSGTVWSTTLRTTPSGKRMASSGTARARVRPAARAR
jgi:hypothetical protein